MQKCNKFTFTVEEFVDFETTVYEMMMDYVETNALLYSKPFFHETLIDDIFELFYQEWIQAGICQENEDEGSHDTSDEIFLYDCIQIIHDNFFDLFEFLYPRRSYYNTISNDIYEDEKTETKMEKIQNTIFGLYSIEQTKQKTDEWYETRHGIFTASNCWKLFGSQSQYNSIIYEKCCPYSKMRGFHWETETPMNWGILYEPVSVLLYEHLYHTKVGEFGCIIHPDHPFIGASPDGINIDENSERFGRMLEIKNIVNREITGIPKEEYWIQMQMQMETCNLDECDFMETRFKEFDTEDQFYENGETHEWTGVFMAFIKRDMQYNHTNQEKPTYVYLPLDIPLDKDTVDEWINTTKMEKNEEFVLYKVHYWYLDEMSCVLVKRNKKWFEVALPIIKTAKETIIQEKQMGYSHREPKRNSARIQNTVKTERLCVIKLDE
jgi:putative phage-type endonuclease